MNKVVVTGLGVVSPIGLGWRDYWDSLVAGTSGEGPITLFDADGFPTTIAAEVRDFDVEEHWDGPLPADFHHDRQTCFGLAASAMAVQDAGLRPGRLGKAGIVLGCGLGVVRMEDVAGHLDGDGGFDAASLLAGAEAAHPASLMRTPQDRLAGALAGHLEVDGPVEVITSACAAGPQAIGTAFRMLRDGELDVAVCGATDSMVNPVGLAGFVLLGAASTANDTGRTSRPFDATRSGLVMGEGAAVVVLETLEHARRRGAEPYGEVAGFGSSLDAHHITEPHPRGEGAAAAMRRAIADAGLRPADVGHVNAHGTATAIGDRLETMAIKTVLGAHAREITVTSNKSMIGHLIAACGAVEFVSTVLTVRTGTVPPTLNYRHPDPDCDLDYVPGAARRDEVEVALTNSFGLGGQNGCLVVRRS